MAGKRKGSKTVKKSTPTDCGGIQPIKPLSPKDVDRKRATKK